MLTQETLFNGRCREPMPPTKLTAFLGEFPWVRERVRGLICRAYVSRVEPSILGKKRFELETTIFEPSAREDISLLDGTGRLVTADADIEKTTYSRKYCFFGKRIRKTRVRRVDGDVRSTINEKLGELGDKAESIHFVLSYFDLTGTVIVYKMPNGLSLPAWIAQQTAAEATELRNTCAAIDAEAGTLAAK